MEGSALVALIIAENSNVFELSLIVLKVAIVDNTNSCECGY